MSVEVLRFACAMMAKEYALGTINLGGEFLFQTEGMEGALHKREVPDDDAGHREGHWGQKNKEATSGGEACGRADGHGQAW